MGVLSTGFFQVPSASLTNRRPARQIVAMTKDVRLATRDDLQQIKNVVQSAYRHYIARIGRNASPQGYARGREQGFSGKRLGHPDGGWPSPLP
jgi:hypothetical protein